MEPNPFVGNVKVQSLKYGDIYKIGLSPEGIAKIRESVNASGWSNLELRRGKSGKWLIMLDTYDKDKQREDYSQPPPPPQQQAVRFSREDARPPEDGMPPAPGEPFDVATDIPF